MNEPLSAAASLMMIGVLVVTPIAAAPRQDIPKGYRQIASEHGLSADVLYATALTASGRVLHGQRLRPWPWTLTIAGRRHYYATRTAAHRALVAYVTRGQRRVAVGLMGLPWHRYRAAFRNPWTALDPYTNLHLAARQLASHLAARSLPEATRVPLSVDELISELAPRFSLDPKLVRAVAAAESNFNPRAESHKGAQGLMQLIPATATRFGVKNVWDPKENLTGGMRYLAWLLAYYRGDLARALAAYNAGEAAVDRYRGIPPYAETRAYVARVLGRYGRQTHPYRLALAEVAL